jgi:hypothetical protein
MSILRFRIIFEDFDDVHRDIDFTADHTFADLFNELLLAVEFDNKHDGEFFLADHNWRKGDSIGKINGQDQKVMQKVDLVDHIDDPHQKFLFVYDQNVRWSFTIELIRIIPSAEYKVVYPKIASKSGIPPIQYKESLIIPTKEKPAEDGRGRRKPKTEADDDELLAMLGSMALDEEDEDSGSAASEDNLAIEGEEIELEAEDLETDNEIAKLAEEFNNTTEIGESEDSEGYGDDDDDYGSGDDEDEDYGRSGGSDYDE